MAISGIYKITNKINNKAYIGQSVNIFQRWKYHRTHIDNEQALYKALKKYGVENFTFEILEETEADKNILNEKEIYYIEKYKTYGKGGYNLTPGGGSAHNAFINISEQDIIDIRTRKIKPESPTAVYADYEDLIPQSVFHKIWTGEHYPQIMSEIYRDKDRLKEIERELIRGENKFCAILTEQDVINIRTAKKNGEKRGNVYLLYKDKISIHTFDGVWYGKKWKHIIV